MSAKDGNAETKHRLTLEPSARTSLSFSPRDRVLVTGAGGFIGSHLTEALVRTGADVVALVHYNSRSAWGNLEDLDDEIRRSVRVIAGDICDPYFVRSLIRGRTVVFHLAALVGIPYSYSAPASYVGINVGGTLNVLQAALECGVERVVHTSTSEVYGTAQYIPMDESHPLQAQSPYAASKIAADKLAESFYASFELPVVTLRPFNTFGPRQSARAIVPAIAVQALVNGSARIGSLAPIRDLCFVTDIVHGFLLAGKAAAVLGEVVNLGTGSGISIGDLACRIFRLIGLPLAIEEDGQRIRPERSEVMRLVSCATKATDLLGWVPTQSLDDGLSHTIEWLRSHAVRYKQDLYIV